VGCLGRGGGLKESELVFLKRQKRLEDGVEARRVAIEGTKGAVVGCFVVIEAEFYSFLGPSRSSTSKIIRCGRLCGADASGYKA
jgi:hypothetical protein